MLVVKLNKVLNMNSKVFRYMRVGDLADNLDGWCYPSSHMSSPRTPSGLSIISSPLRWFETDEDSRFCYACKRLINEFVGNGRHSSSLINRIERSLSVLAKGLGLLQFCLWIETAVPLCNRGKYQWRGNRVWQSVKCLRSHTPYHSRGTFSSVWGSSKSWRLS